MLEAAPQPQPVQGGGLFGAVGGGGGDGGGGGAHDAGPTTGELRDAAAAVRSAEESFCDALAVFGSLALNRNFVNLLGT